MCKTKSKQTLSTKNENRKKTGGEKQQVSGEHETKFRTHTHTRRLFIGQPVSAASADKNNTRHNTTHTDSRTQRRDTSCKSFRTGKPFLVFLRPQRNEQQTRSTSLIKPQPERLLILPFLGGTGPRTKTERCHTLPRTMLPTHRSHGGNKPAAAASIDRIVGEALPRPTLPGTMLAVVSWLPWFAQHTKKPFDLCAVGLYIDDRFDSKLKYIKTTENASKHRNKQNRPRSENLVPDPPLPTTSYRRRVRTFDSRAIDASTQSQPNEPIPPTFLPPERQRPLPPKDEGHTKLLPEQDASKMPPDHTAVTQKSHTMQANSPSLPLSLCVIALGSLYVQAARLARTLSAPTFSPEKNRTTITWDPSAIYCYTDSRPMPSSPRGKSHVVAGTNTNIPYTAPNFIDRDAC